SISMGIGKGAEYGILIKKAEALELLQKTNVVITDKTGTLTEGKPSLEEIIPLKNTTENQRIDITAQLNASSEHPIANAFKEKATSLNIDFKPPTMVASVAGKGVQGMINGKKVLLGNAALLKQNSVAINMDVLIKVEQLQRQGITVSYVVISDELVGLAVIHDAIKSYVKQTEDDQLCKGVDVIMRTGDHEQTVNAIAKQI